MPLDGFDVKFGFEKGAFVVCCMEHALVLGITTEQSNLHPALH